MTRKPFWGDCCLPQVYEGGVTLAEIWDAMEAASDIGAYMEAHVIARRYGLGWMCPICVERTVNPQQHKIPAPSSTLEFAFLVTYGQRRYLRVCPACYAIHEESQRPKTGRGINISHSGRGQALTITQDAIVRTTPMVALTRGK